ncbi:MAG: PaaI family thioesterase [Thermodesulfobacteriota bacterium]|nr:PaaI family thioesterase [Thermodesulfobacteriota bacterium]
MTNPPTNLGPHSVYLDQWLECAPFEKQLGLKILQAEQGHSILTLPFRAEFANGGNLLHGGALVSLADATAVIAIKSLLTPWTHFGTINMQVEFIRPVLQGVVTARCNVHQIEERLWQAEVMLEDDQQIKVMTMKAIFKISKRRLQQHATV